METRFVPDAPGAWLVYDLGTLVLALPPEFRAAADAVAALPATGVDEVLAALRASGIADAAPFAIVDAEGDGVRFVLRGPATVAAGSETLTGLGAQPWLDRVVRGTTVARLTVPGGEWTLASGASAPPTSVPPTSIPSTSIPSTSIPSTSIPSTSIPSTSIPSVSAPASSLPSLPTAAAFPAPPPAPGHRPVPPPTPPDVSAVAPPPPLLEPQDELTEIPENSVPLGPVAPAAPASTPAADSGIGEHDGHTVLASDLAAVRAGDRAADETPDGPTAEDKTAEDKTVVVDEIARLRAKRSAGLAAPVVAPAAPVPALSLELPDGTREPLDAVLVVGRAPAAPEGARVVRLGDGDISRTHARVAVEGGTVVVTDLGSRNGTVVRLPGRAPQKLREHEPTPVLPGTVIDFGGGVELRVRED